MSKFDRWKAALGLLAAAGMTLGGLAGCGGSGGKDVVVDGDTSLVFAKRKSEVLGNPTDAIEFAPGGDLMLLDLASPSAGMQNLTRDYTKGGGDVAEPEISYDGKRVLFSMRGPDDPNFTIWEMDLASRAMHRVIPDDETAHLGDDLGAAYLPDGRIVFSSNRQTGDMAKLESENTEPYPHLDEYERERATNLHVMNADGSGIHQISFNQSHDRNPTVLLTGEVMFSRWDHVGERNHFPIFFANPDGTNIFVRYGAFSPGNSFLQPREMPDGTVMTTLMPLSGTHLGGALMDIDIKNFSENDQPADPEITGEGQKQLSLQDVNFDTRRGLATFGRYSSPYPLWDGTNRALVSWSPSRPTQEPDPLTGGMRKAEGEPLYGIYMFDLDKKTLRPISIPPEGWSYVDPVAVAPRPSPNAIPDKPLDAELAARGLGLLNIKSVYDTDHLDLMGPSVLAPGEEIPQTTPPEGDVRSSVADLEKLKDPAQTRAAQRPARFLRVTRAVPTPEGLSREAIGTTELEMQQIVGYAEVEPDGSARIVVPADTPLTLAVVDSHGRAFQTHTNWLQVRPGETRTCDGCHSPRRGVALNVTPIAGDHPNTLLAAQSGESMAETRTRLNPDHRDLTADPTYTDVWTDPAKAGRLPDPPLVLTYIGLTTPAPQNGVINYPDQIAPLFVRCVVCHNNIDPNDPVSKGLDLRDTTAGTGRSESYETLTVGKVAFDANGVPIVTEDEDGEVRLEREEAQVKTGDSRNSSRSSKFFEKMTETELTNRAPLPTKTVDHSNLFDAGELRVLAEWIDVGAQYYNDPFDTLPGQRKTLDHVRRVNGLDQTVFENAVHPILMARCAMCHQPAGSNAGASLPSNQFVITGDDEGDYDVTLTMVTNVCTPAANPLLQRPTSTGAAPPHPQVGTPPLPVLSVADPDYQTILQWIAAGECKP